MKKMFCFILICFQLCILFASCGGQQDNNLENEPVQLSDGTYYPVKCNNYGNYSAFELYSLDDFPSLSEYFTLTEETILDIAVAILRNTGKHHLEEPTQYDIVYSDELDTYYVCIFPLKPTLDGGVNFMIRSNGEILAIWNDG